MKNFGAAIIMKRRDGGTRYPPAAAVFDIAPAPPQRADSRSTMYPAGLSHFAALRRACLDDQLMSRAIPASWVDEDDPNDATTLVLCSLKVRVPRPFDHDPVCKAYEKELDRIEAKFRAGRKDKTIGGQLGSIIIKKKPLKSKKAAALARRTDSALLAHNNASAHSNSHKRPASFAPSSERSAKRLRDSDDSSDLNSQAVDYTAAYRAAVKTDVIKAARTRAAAVASQARLAKGIATACARDARKLILRSMRLSDEAHRRARRVLKDVLSYWKKEDKERQEERKKLMARAEEHRRIEAEEREAQRQRNKLKFLLGQSEAFSSFLQAKDRATTTEASNALLAQESRQVKQAAACASKQGTAAIDGITGTEDDDELARIAKNNAAGLVAAHQARIKQFDIETVKRKSVADESAAKLAADRDFVRDALPTLNGVSDAERNAMRTDDNALSAAVAPAETSNSNGVRASADSSSLANAQSSAPPAGVDGKPVVAPVRQPSILNCKMKDYQLRGLSWLVSLYDQGINGILADEMGLGKTLQTISLLAYLCEQEDNWGPFLVVSPKATLHNWQQEVTKFCPVLKVLPYWGSKTDRAELRKYWSQKRMYRRDSEFQVCITSYETLTMDEKYFHRVKWQYMVLDEAQAIKNSSSSRWKALLQFPCRNRLLLTGTPLQNKLSELWALLHFIMPQIFDSHAEFADWFSKDIEGHAKNNKILDAATLSRLRTLLDPFMLRRVKRDVESEMPPKTEMQLSCSLSGRQRQLYAKIKANVSIAELVQSVGGSGADVDRNSKLMNIVMQLRKVCNHPETFERRDPVAPYQFQRKPPPSHVPHPPSVLVSGSSPAPPLEIKFLTRADIVQVAPRAIMKIREFLRDRTAFAGTRYGIWSRTNVYAGLYASTRPRLSILRICGGMSVSDIVRCMAEDATLWNWEAKGMNADEQLRRLYNVYGIGGYADRYAGNNVLGRPQRVLLQTRARWLNRLRSNIILPRQGSPADIMLRDTRLLKSVRVFIPPVSAPPPELYLPGDSSFARYHHGSLSQIPYPDMPRSGSLHATREVYSAWRSLFGTYGAHVGTAPIVMPEAGRLIADSGKMQVLDPLLRKLKAEGHKVLIYSQFTRVLDILEDYCGKTLLKFVRLDGQSALADRRDIVADWQANEELFVFLLSTRAGGVGLNLTAADTVIFFDSDWNPTQDLQAMDRAHRLGQERPVTVYRLISPGTIEERMLVRAQQKSRINDLVIKGGGINTDMEEPKDTEITDIAALLMGEEELANLIDTDTALATARAAVDIVNRKRGGSSAETDDVKKRMEL